MSIADRPLAVLVHELRSPVAALVAIANAYAAADDRRRARLIELAGAAVRSIERLLADGATASLRVELVDLGSVARDAVEAAGLRGPVVLGQAEDGLVVDGDALRLRQALDNLIGNALAHSSAVAPVSVTAQRDGTDVVIAVVDKGDGIAPGDLARVFEPGVRLTDAQPGSGLGLAIVRTIAQAHGGEVEVESTPGQGATFRLVLPGASGGR